MSERVHPMSRHAASPSPAGAPRAPEGAPPEQDLHLLDRLAVVYRYRRVAFAVFVLTSTVLMIQGYSNVQYYRAQARVLIEDERSTAVPGLSSAESMYWEDPEPYRQTQYRILRGRELTRRVIQRLDLQAVPEFNGSEAPPPSPMGLVRSAVQGALALVGRRAPEEVREAPKPDETADESALIDAFIGRVDVTPVTGSKLVDVGFRSTDAKFASEAANALIEEYVAQNLEVKLQGTNSMLEWLDGELRNQQQKVEQSERDLAEYRERQNAMSLDERNNIVVSRLNALNEALLRARTGRIEKESLYNQVKAITDPSQAESLPVITQNPQVQSLRSQLTELQRQKAQLSERYGDKHPEMQKVNASLADAQRQLGIATSNALQAVRNEYERVTLEERTLSQNLEGAKADAQDLSRKSVSYNVMEREAQSSRAVYEALLQRANELRVSSNSRANNVRIVDRAEIPRGPMTPTGRRTWLLAFAVGLIAAVAVAYGLDYMNDTVKTPDDITRVLKLAFLGLVPSVRGGKTPILASSHSPHEFGEAFRSMRTSIMARYPGEGTKLMLVTSAQPLEGKTTTACNIAIALAYGGARVLLVDADMRRPGLHRPLRLTNERGLSQVLIGQARVRDVIQRTIDPNLLAITAGRVPPNPSELLSSERMKTLLTNLTHGPFDWIIVDAPPVLAVTDAVILAPLVSGVTFVIGAEMTRRRLAERAVETVLASHPKQVGAVLNKVDLARNKYYYSRYHGSQYKNYYAEAV
jgi:succinoglycan biosynthesis transport protein ExoP